jgi:hypothetical protein
MMNAKRLSSIYWVEAVATTLFVLNWSLKKLVAGMTPYEAWYDKKPVVHHLRPFGCIAHVKRTSPNLKKHDDRSCAMVFVGYEQGTKGYRVFDHSTHRISMSHNVVFDEYAQWNWKENDVDDLMWGTFTIEYSIDHEISVVDGTAEQKGG